MKIELNFPYNKDWKHGYIVVNPEGRRTVILFNDAKDRTSTQYGRYLLATKLGRYLTKEETVDHIDGNKQNDSIDNLQILSHRENICKSQKKPDYECICPICGKSFIVPRQKASGIKARERILSGKRCCSRKCGSIQTSRTLSGK